MTAPASGHWTFGITVGYGLGLGVRMLMTICTGLRTVCIKTLAPTTNPVPPITVATDVALAATATLEVAPATTATLDVTPATAATFELAPATATLEVAISANSVVGGVEEGMGGAIVIDVVAQFTTSSAALTVLSMCRNPMACATNSLYTRAKNEKESKSEQSMCCSTKHAVDCLCYSIAITTCVICTYSISVSDKFAPSFLRLAHGSGIFAMQPQIVAPTPKGSS
jgi:hypothetical protein